VNLSGPSDALTHDLDEKEQKKRHASRKKNAFLI
jgi:hypothetical protein